MPRDYLSVLPSELLSLITIHLSPEDAPGSQTALALTCKSLYHRIFPEHLWAPRISKARNLRSRFDSAETMPFLRLLERDLSPQWELCEFCGSLHEGWGGLKGKHKGSRWGRAGGNGVKERPLWGPRDLYSRDW